MDDPRSGWPCQKEALAVSRGDPSGLGPGFLLPGWQEDYLAIHEKIDSSKSAHAEVTHRCVFHSAFGIYLIEDIFGRTVVNSYGKEVFVRDVAEQHVLEDLGCIPSLSDWLREMPARPWMAGARKQPIQVVE
jgi:hypothetical protein